MQFANEAIKLWDLSDPLEIGLIKHRENAVFSVKEVASGNQYILRVHRYQYHTDAAINSELMWMKALTGNEIATPGVIPGSDNKLVQTVNSQSLPEPRQCDLFEWVEGQQLGTIEGGGEIDTESLLKIYQVLGRQMAKLHNFCSNWELPDGFERHAWDEDGLLGENPVWGRFWELEPLTTEQQKLIQAARLKLQEKLEALGKSKDRYGLIHADFLPENLLISGESVQLIDFDDSGFGWYLFDIATAMFFHLGEDYFDDLLGSLLQGYHSERELPEQDLEYLPAFFVARGFTYLGWLHTRKETETAKEMTSEVIEGIMALVEDFLGN